MLLRANGTLPRPRFVPSSGSGDVAVVEKENGHVELGAREDGVLAAAARAEATQNMIPCMTKASHLAPGMYDVHRLACQRRSVGIAPSVGSRKMP